jgi:hypothetical protein
MARIRRGTTSRLLTTSAAVVTFLDNHADLFVDFDE